jgi:sensor domain CHASE-containing protein
LIITLSTTIIISGLAYYWILGSFTSLEEDQSRGDMTVILNTFHEQGQTLASTVKTFGANDDTYQFLLGNSSQYINTTLENSKFEELQLNFLIIYNRTGSIYYTKAFDLSTSQETEITEEMLHFFSEPKTYTSLSLMNESSGIILWQNLPLYLASSPITTGDRSGISRGTLVTGRYMDVQYIKRVSDITDRPIEVAVIGDPNIASDLREAGDHFEGMSSSIYVHPLNESIIASYALLPDLNKEPGLILKTERSREIFSRGVVAVQYFIISLGLITMLFIFLGMRLINNAFTQLDRNIEQFAILGDHIRNPLTVIVGLADLYETEISTKILHQAKIIDEIINQLDKGWIESEKIKEFLRKYTKK